MGRLLRIEPCPVCNYHIEGVLHFGGSTRSRLFIDHQYLLARCHDCDNIVSVLVRTPDYDLPHVLKAAEADISTLEARVASGDAFARILLPLHRRALADDQEIDAVNLQKCTVCGSGNLTIYGHSGGDEGERFDQGVAWLDCPRCEEGKLLVQTVGSWDEIDDAP